MTTAHSNRGSGNKKWKRSRWSDCSKRLIELLRTYNHLDAEGVKRISFQTMRERKKILRQGFKYLHEEGGMSLRKPENFAVRHARVLIAHWEQQKLSAATLQLRFSVFSTFCSWIGKRGMLGDIKQYLSDPGVAKRTYVAKEDKSWTSKGIDVIAKLAEVRLIDPRLAISCMLMYVFGLRVREAVTLQPNVADQGNTLVVVKGTKGGRPREVTIEIEHPWQRTVLDEAKAFANKSTGSLIPDTYKRDSWIKRAYAIAKKCGISREHGITLHGLRHERANDIYEAITGVKSPVRGGEPVDKQLDDHARLVVAEHLGHSRKQIAGAYLGGILREQPKASWSSNHAQTPAAPQPENP